jgi:ATP-dependent Clp protease ATP-binding subunit ClpC
MFDCFTDKAILVVMVAKEEAKRFGDKSLGQQHLLLGMVVQRSGVSGKVLSSMGLDLQKVRTKVVEMFAIKTRILWPWGQDNDYYIPFTNAGQSILDLATNEASEMGMSYVGTEHLLLALINDTVGIGRVILERLDVNLSHVKRKIMHVLAENTRTGDFDKKAWRRLRSQIPYILEFGVDLTERARKGTVDPVIGRVKQIDRVVTISGRCKKNNAVLLGEPGVGKTALAEGLAIRIINNDVPDVLLNKYIFSIDISLMVAGTKFRGEFEKRLEGVLSEAKDPRVILMLDEIHILIGAGSAEGSVDAANMVKPALSRGKLQVIGATTFEEYKKYIDRDAALERRFQSVEVSEPSVGQTYEILYGLREKYEQHHEVLISDEALRAASKLSSQFIADRFLPDKAIDIIDEACSRGRLLSVALPPVVKELETEIDGILKEKSVAVLRKQFGMAENCREREAKLRKRVRQYFEYYSRKQRREKGKEKIKPVITDEDIANLICAWTRIPVTKVTEDESQKLLVMEDTLDKSVIDQEMAVSVVCKAIRRSRMGIKDPNRPIANFLFVGPTGVGKTELAKVLAGYFFSSEDDMIRLDMSEYIERHSVSKIIGSPPGYNGYDEGGQLTEKIRRNPHSLILFDEVEKAHPWVWNLFLQLFDDGRLTDGKGRTVSFKQTLLILTSNLGSRVVSEFCDTGFIEWHKNCLWKYPGISKTEHLTSLVKEELKSTFSPELINRVDEIVVFNSLASYAVLEIVRLMVGKMAVQLFKALGIGVDVTYEGMKDLVRRGYDKAYGARPLRRMLTQDVEDPMTDWILSNEIEEGDNVMFHVSAEGEFYGAVITNPSYVPLYKRAGLY